MTINPNRILGVGNDLYRDPIIKANTLISQSGQSEIIGTPSTAHAKLETSQLTRGVKLRAAWLLRTGHIFEKQHFLARRHIHPVSRNINNINELPETERICLNSKHELREKMQFKISSSLIQFNRFVLNSQVKHDPA